MPRPSARAPLRQQPWRAWRPLFLVTLLPCLLASLVLVVSTTATSPSPSTPPPVPSSPFKVCIVGAGMGGASAALFLRNVSRALASAAPASPSSPSSASAAQLSPLPELDIHVFERAGRVGGRMLLLKVPGGGVKAEGERAEGDVVEVEAGASIIHGKNLHLVRLAQQLRLETAPPTDMDFGIWGGHCSSSSAGANGMDSSRSGGSGGGASSSGASSEASCSGGGFVFQEWKLGEGSVAKWVAEWVNAARMVARYTLAGLRAMRAFVGDMLQRWMRLYEEDKEGGGAFERPEDLLRSLGLLELTRVTLTDALLDRGLPAVLINELVTMITRVQYGQNATMSGLPGAVGLCGTGSELWKVRGGNWQLAQGAIQLANASLHLHSRVARIAGQDQAGTSGTSSGDGDGGGYVLYMESRGGKGKPTGESAGGEGRGGSGGNRAGDGSDGDADTDGGGAAAAEVHCDAVVIATPMEQNGIAILPAPPLLPLRTYQHTHVTFVRGALNHTYFGAADPSSLPGLIGTLESDSIPFSSISRLAPLASDGSSVFKVFSRQHLSNDTLNLLFRSRSFKRSIDWPAYPHYAPPDAFAPFLLDGHHLYYTSTFESAASALETAAVAAKNVAQLLLSRLQQQQQQQQKGSLLGRGGGDGESMGLASPVGGAHGMTDEL
ncbi:hypothetical protein CLOM_g16928 [Closterium sp. NIES-68]|nr:hypothetical protein CLOM_g16928 [Closterium sp. NIES-68]GJP65453.1 hypothetical protein CLOP_g22326 [Closterium sp. NIES-67]